MRERDYPAADRIPWWVRGYNRRQIKQIRARIYADRAAITAILVKPSDPPRGVS